MWHQVFGSGKRRYVNSVKAMPIASFEPLAIRPVFTPFDHAERCKRTIKGIVCLFCKLFYLFIFEIDLFALFYTQNELNNKGEKSSKISIW